MTIACVADRQPLPTALCIHKVAASAHPVPEGQSGPGKFRIRDQPDRAIALNPFSARTKEGTLKSIPSRRRIPGPEHYGNSGEFPKGDCLGNGPIKGACNPLHADLRCTSTKPIGPPPRKGDTESDLHGSRGASCVPELLWYDAICLLLPSPALPIIV